MSVVTLGELESIKSSGTKSEEVKAQARRLTRLLDKNWDKVKVAYNSGAWLKSFCSNEANDLQYNNDAKIAGHAFVMQKQAMSEREEVPLFVTDDLCCRAIARSLGVQIAVIEDREQQDYLGYKEVVMTDDELAEFYTTCKQNLFDSKLNEYLIICNPDGEVIDRRKWNGEMYDVLRYKQISNDYIGKVKPRNPQQELCFDMLQDDKTPIKVITGGFGVGKDFIMISHAIHAIMKSGKFERIVWVRNNIEVKGSRQIGHLPGNINEKLYPYAQIIADHVGGKEQMDVLVGDNKIELCHLGFLRGRDIKNSIIYCSEAENLTKEHVQLLMGRVGEGSQLWLNGDYKQVDADVFRVNNGLNKLIGTLAGHEKFGYVKLHKTERSEVAAMADLLD